MKRFIKFICTALVAVISCAACLSLVACEDIKTLSVKVSVYDTSSKTNVEKEIEIDLYRHLAPDTVDAIISYVEKGYYNDLLFYKQGSSEKFPNQIMLGDYIFSEGAVKEYTQDYVNEIAGEFEKAGVKGSNLSNAKGSVGLWRTWENGDTYKQNGGNAYNSGKATIFMPTQSISGFDGYFCVFGQIDLDDEDNDEAFDAITDVFGDSTLYTSYVSYYLGKDVENLTLVIETLDDYNEKIDNGELEEADIFVPKDEQSYTLAKREFVMPIATIDGVENVITAKVVSVSVK